MLGIGIFLSPAQMASRIASPWIFFAVWIVAAIVVLGGAVAYAELGTRLPKAGGDYVYHREALGPSVAFASGWCLFGAIFSGSIAAVAVALFDYQISALTGLNLGKILVGPFTASQVLGATLIIGLTWLNARGVRPSALAQKILTLTPVFVLFVVAIIAISLWGTLHTPAPIPTTVSTDWTMHDLVAAYLAAYFAYSGWNAVSYVAGEVSDPRRNIPRSLLGGTILVAVLYMVLCVVFVLVLGMGGVAQAGEVGSALARSLGGETAYLAMNGLILLCLLATLNGSVLGGGRVAYAMGQDGAFLRRAGQLDPKTGSPNFALWLQASWATVLVLTNQFETLLLAVSLAMILTGSLTVISLYILRTREPEGPHWRAFGYPWLPGLYLVSTVVVLGVESSRLFGSEAVSLTPLLGLALVAGAFIAHTLWRRGAARRIA